MAQARERGIEPKLGPELEAIIKAYDGIDSFMSAGVAADTQHRNQRTVS